MAKQVKSLTAKEVDDHYELSWYCGTSKDLWNKILELVKMIPTRRWDPDIGKKGAWVVDVNPRTTEMITRIGFKIKEGPKKEKKRPERIPVKPTAHRSIILQDVTDKARDYQLDNIKRIKEANYRILDASDMGTGKTLAAVSSIRESKIKPVLIIVPSTLKLNFKRECELWLNPKDKYSVHVVRALPSGDLDLNYKDKDICIINYAMVWKHLEYILTQFKPNYVILDEAHLVKTGEKPLGIWYPDYKFKQDEVMREVRGKKVVCKLPPKRVRAIEWIVNGLEDETKTKTGINWNGIKHFLPMTGTPLVNSAADLYNILHLLDPKRFHSRWDFEDFFCTVETGFKNGTWKITGSKNLDLLNCMLVKDYMIRVTKDEVLPELPKTTKTVIPQELELDYRIAYDDAIDRFRKWAQALEESEEEIDEDDPYIQSMKRRHFKNLLDMSRDGKMKNCLKFTDGLLKTYPDKKFIIFAHHKKIVELIMNHFGDMAVKLVGGMKEEAKEDSVYQFQNNPNIRVFVGNLKAASVGITLTASDSVIFFETGFNADVVAQAIDRSRRIGLVADKVTAYFLTGEETIEKFIVSKLDRKMIEMNKAIDGKDTADEDMLEYLWDVYIRGGVK